MKSGNVKFLEPSGPLQACKGTDFILPLPCIIFPKSSQFSPVMYYTMQHTSLYWTLLGPFAPLTGAKTRTKITYSDDIQARHCPLLSYARLFSHIIFSLFHAVAYPGIFFRGGGLTNSVEDRENGDLRGGNPLVRDSGSSCNLVQEISFHIVKFSQFLVL